MILRSRHHSERRRRREKEIEAVLLEHGLMRGPRRVSSPVTDDLEADGFARRLRPALESLGPLFASFGRYLSSRLDLLPVTECLELAPEDRVEPTPSRVLLEEIRAALGAEPSLLFSEFEHRPLASEFVYQSHRAWLADGRRVVVKMLQPALAQRLEELDLLARLEPVWQLAGAPVVPLESVIADFRRSVSADMDLGAQAEALEALGGDGEQSVQVGSLRVVRELSSQTLIVLEEPEGAERLAATRPDAETRAASVGNENLARRLCRLWLYQALVVGRFPVSFNLSDVVELTDGRLALLGGTFAHLPAASQSHLLSYLQATAAHDPVEACGWLLKEVAAGGSEPDPDRLRRGIRQLIPFRDGSWSRDGESLAEFLFLHWRLATECGYRLRRPMLDFSRGLSRAALAGRQLAPRTDSLREGLEDLRWLDGWRQLRQWTDLGQLAHLVEGNLAASLDLPAKLDAALTAGASGGARPEVEASPGTSAVRHSSVQVLALIALMAAVALIAGQVRSSAGLGAWAEPLLAVAFVGLGALLVRVVGKSR